MAKLGSKYKPTFGNVALDLLGTAGNLATMGIMSDKIAETMENPFLKKVNTAMPEIYQTAATVAGAALGVPQAGQLVGGIQQIGKTTQSAIDPQMQQFALGGNIQSYEGMPNHNQGGVNVDALGNPSAQSRAKGIAEVEGGEFSYDGYVFSNRLKPSKKAPTFAEEFKALTKKYGYDFKNKKFKRDSDPIVKNEFKEKALQLKGKQDNFKVSQGLAFLAEDGSIQDIPQMAKGGNIPPELLKEQNPYLVPEYTQPMVGNTILPDPNRPKVPGTQMSEYKMGINMDGKDYSIPTVVGGQYLGAEGAVERFRATGESFKNTTNPQSYSKFYDEVDKLGIMKKSYGGTLPKAYAGMNLEDPPKFDFMRGKTLEDYKSLYSNLDEEDTFMGTVYPKYIAEFKNDSARTVNWNSPEWYKDNIIEIYGVPYEKDSDMTKEEYYPYALRRFQTQWGGFNKSLFDYGYDQAIQMYPHFKNALKTQEDYWNISALAGDGNIFNPYGNYDLTNKKEWDDETQGEARGYILNADYKLNPQYYPADYTPYVFTPSVQPTRNDIDLSKLSSIPAYINNTSNIRNNVIDPKTHPNTNLNISQQQNKISSRIPSEAINLNSIQSIPGYVKMPNAFTRSAAIPYPNEYTDINNLQQASGQILGQRGFIPNTQNVNAAISTQLGTNPGLKFTPTIGTLDTSEMSSMRPKGIPNNQVPENQSYKNNVSRRLFETQPVFDFGAGNVLKYPHSSVMSGGNYIGKTPNTVLQQTPMDTQATTDWVNSELNNIRNMPKAPYQTTPIQYNDSEFKIGNITDNLEGLPNVGNKTQSSFLGDLPTSAKVGMGIQGLTGLANAAYAFTRKPQTATPNLYTPEDISLANQREDIREQARLAERQNLDLARRTGSLSGFMNTARAGAAGINRNAGAALGESYMREEAANVGARNQALAYNAQERSRIDEINRMEKDAIDSLRMGAISNIGTMAGNMSRDVLAYQSEAEKAGWMGSPNFQNFVIDGKNVKGVTTNMTSAVDGTAIYALANGKYVTATGQPVDINDESLVIKPTKETTTKTSTSASSNTGIKFKPSKFSLNTKPSSIF